MSEESRHGLRVIVKLVGKAKKFFMANGKIDPNNILSVSVFLPYARMELKDAAFFSKQTVLDGHAVSQGIGDAWDFVPRKLQNSHGVYTLWDKAIFPLGAKAGVLNVLGLHHGDPEDPPSLISDVDNALIIARQPESEPILSKLEHYTIVTNERAHPLYGSPKNGLHFAGAGKQLVPWVSIVRITEDTYRIKNSPLS